MEADQWLRFGAASGNTFAMERLGERLMEGLGVSADLDEGLWWLKRSSSEGNPFAMEKLGKYLLDGEVVSKSSEEGLTLLNEAASRGNHFAAVSLALRCFLGETVPAEPDGRRLKNMAASNCRVSMLLLGAYTERREGALKGTPAATYWLSRAGCFSPESMALSGTWLYGKALGKHSMRDRSLIAEACATLLLQAYSQGYTPIAVTLAYLIRRNEAPSVDVKLDELLLPLIRQGDALALLNQALRLASGFQGPVDWEAADALIARMSDISEVLAWWSCLAEEDDSEGHLVLAWLERHGHLAGQIEPRQIERRLHTLQKSNWKIPTWFFEKAGGVCDR